MVGCDVKRVQIVRCLLSRLQPSAITEIPDEESDADIKVDLDLEESMDLIIDPHES
jgi:hypothetical protein